MTVGDMRRHINNAYDGKWQQVWTMPDKQIMAIYFNMKQRGSFEKKKESKPKDTEVQLSIYDILASKQ